MSKEHGSRNQLKKKKNKLESLSDEEEETKAKPEIGSPLTEEEAEETEAKEKKSKDLTDSHEVFSLYFSGMPYDTTEDQLHDFISPKYSANIV